MDIYFRRRVASFLSGCFLGLTPHVAFLAILVALARFSAHRADYELETLIAMVACVAIGAIASARLHPAPTTSSNRLVARLSAASLFLTALCFRFESSVPTAFSPLSSAIAAGLAGAAMASSTELAFASVGRSAAWAGIVTGLLGAFPLIETLDQIVGLEEGTIVLVLAICAVLSSLLAPSADDSDLAETQPANRREISLLALLLFALFATTSVAGEWMEEHCRHIHRARVYYAIVTVAGLAAASTWLPKDRQGRPRLALPSVRVAAGWICVYVLISSTGFGRGWFSGSGLLFEGMRKSTYLGDILLGVVMFGVPGFAVGWTLGEMPRLRYPAPASESAHGPRPFLHRGAALVLTIWLAAIPLGLVSAVSGEILKYAPHAIAILCFLGAAAIMKRGERAAS